MSFPLKNVYIVNYLFHLQQLGLKFKPKNYKLFIST